MWKRKVMYLLLQNPKQEDSIPQVAIDRQVTVEQAWKKREAETNRVAPLNPPQAAGEARNLRQGGASTRTPSKSLACYKTRRIILKTKQESLGQVRSACARYYGAFQLTIKTRCCF